MAASWSLSGEGVAVEQQRGAAAERKAKRREHGDGVDAPSPQRQHDGVDQGNGSRDGESDGVGGHQGADQRVGENREGEDGRTAGERSL
jgi:hypothetical protein